MSGVTQHQKIENVAENGGLMTYREIAMHWCCKAMRNAPLRGRFPSPCSSCTLSRKGRDFCDGVKVAIDRQSD